jgi:hypothetical protein
MKAILDILKPRVWEILNFEYFLSLELIPLNYKIWF